jgi:predicted RNA-binding protein Jag
MNDPKRRFFSGDSLQQALVQAANHFHLQPEEIAYRPVEKRHGFVKVRRKVVIEVDPEAPRKEPAAPAAQAPAPVPPARSPRPPGAGPVAEGRGAQPAAGEASPARVAAPAGGAVQASGAVPTAETVPSRAVAPTRASGLTAPGAGISPPGSHHQGHAGDEEEEVDPWNRAAPPPPAYPVSRPGYDGDDEDAQPPGLGQGLVSLPERPRNVSERYAVAVGPQADAAARGLELLLRIAGLSLQAKIYQGEDRLEIDLSGADTDWCFADDGEMLMSIEHLLPRVIRSLSGAATLCRVDCDNFHEIREERLRSLAQRVADEVRQRGRPRTLVPMNPADRRIVHVTLADNPAVVTESEGDGYFKRITVRPA